MAFNNIRYKTPYYPNEYYALQQEAEKQLHWTEYLKLHPLKNNKNTWIPREVDRDPRIDMDMDDFDNNDKETV